ncbi:MAG: hypothetical protein ACXW4U_12640 [Anaerolineales bacterium]
MEALDLYRYTGITGIVAGVLNVVVELLPERIGLPLDMLINILGLWVLSALYLRQREVSGVFGLIAYAVEFLGITLVVGFLFTQAFVLPELDAAQRTTVLAGPTGLAAILALALMTLGAVLFGIVTLRAGVFPKWAALLLMAGFIIVPIGAIGSPTAKTIGELILSAGLISMSYALFSEAGGRKLNPSTSN